MADILYEASVYITPRRVRELPFGWYLAREARLAYQFYDVSEDPFASMRIGVAERKIRHEGKCAREIPVENAEVAINALLAGFLEKHAPNDPEALRSIVEKATEAGELSAETRALFERDILPFKNSPLSGKSITELVRSPAAATIFLVAISGANAPVVIIVTPIGIIAMHIAIKSGPRIARWVDKKLKEWLR